MGAPDPNYREPGLAENRAAGGVVEITPEPDLRSVQGVGPGKLGGTAGFLEGSSQGFAFFRDGIFYFRRV